MTIDNSYPCKSEEKETEDEIFSDQLETRESSCSDMFASYENEQRDTNVLLNNSNIENITPNTTCLSNKSVVNVTEEVEKENELLLNQSTSIRDDNRSCKVVMDDSVFVVPGPDIVVIKKKPVVLKPGKMYRRSLSLLKQCETIVVEESCVADTGKCLLWFILWYLF